LRARTLAPLSIAPPSIAPPSIAPPSRHVSCGVACLSNRFSTRRLARANVQRNLAFTRKPSVTRAVEEITTHEMPEIDEGFRIFQAAAPKTREKVAG
jgi:hypothetical protein